MADRFNVVVIGAGAAGLVSAYISAAVKAKVALVEKGKMGGDCLNYGCVPSKTLIKSAKFIEDMRRHKDFGVQKVDFVFDFKDVMRRLHEKIQRIEPHDSAERYRSLGVECFQGEAEIIDAHSVRVGDKVLRTQNIVLAMGASPAIPSLAGLDKVDFLTSENLWDLKELPKKLVVLGGGPVGCEMAQCFARLGSKVVQIEAGNRILSREDEDVARVVIDQFAHEGIDIRTNCKGKAVVIRNGQNFLQCETPGGSQEVEFDRILIAVGRAPNTRGVDWQKLGITLNENKTVKVDKYMRANGKNIYACGDVAGPYQFTHVASHQAWYCAVNALFSPFKKFKVDYSVIPWCTFTDPEVAQVGHNELSARRAKLEFEVTKYDVGDLDRAITESEDRGFVKVLTVKGTDKIIGATIVSHLAGELIGEFVSAMKHGYGLNKILGTIHAYPTYIEANKAAAGVWKKAHAPAWALNVLSHFHRLRR
ncbi:MAG: NAD(P)/FAD-dependent oxidoreductase [Oligoflexales bacterium]